MNRNCVGRSTGGGNEERRIWMNGWKKRTERHKCLNRLFIHQYPSVMSTHLAALFLSVYSVMTSWQRRPLSLSVCVHIWTKNRDGWTDG